LPVPETAPGAAAAEAVGSDAAGAGASDSTAAATTAGASASASAASEAAGEETAFAPDAAVVTAVVSDRGSTERETNAPPLLVEPALAAYAGYASAPSHAFQAVVRGEARFGPGRQAWAAAASLSYGHSSQQNPAVDLGFDSLLAGLALCPPGLTLSFGIWLEACAEARGGVLAVSVTERELPLDVDSDVDSGPRPWFDIGPSLQAGLPLSSRWTLRALTSVTLVLVRDSFVVQRVVVDEDGQEQPGEAFTLYRPPAVSFQLLLGIGYQL